MNAEPIHGGDDVVEYTLKVADLADMSGIPESSVRRYLKQFSEFVVSKEVGRANAYPPETVTLLVRIAELYKDSKSTPEILDILRFEVPINLPDCAAESSLLPQTYLTAEQLATLQSDFGNFSMLLRGVEKTVTEFKETTDHHTSEMASFNKRIDKAITDMNENMRLIRTQNEMIDALRTELLELRSTRRVSILSKIKNYFT